MIETLIYFDESYYKYRGDENNEHVLSIGGYELAFLSDLFASFLFEKSQEHFSWTIYHSIYHNDGMVVFRGNNKVQGIKYLLEEFQQTVNKAEGNQHLQFTAEIW